VSMLLWWGCAYGLRLRGNSGSWRVNGCLESSAGSVLF
jgi:hypothetical protein